MNEQFNKLSPSESERLYLLLQEAGEVVQIVGKILRHGYESTHPDGGPTNRELLEKEIGDFLAAKEMMEANGDIYEDNIKQHITVKHTTVIDDLHHQ